MRKVVAYSAALIVILSLMGCTKVNDNSSTTANNNITTDTNSSVTTDTTSGASPK